MSVPGVFQDIFLQSFLVLNNLLFFTGFWICVIVSPLRDISPAMTMPTENINDSLHFSCMIA